MSALLFLFLFGFMLLGIPIAFCLILAGAGFLAISDSRPMIIVAQKIMVGMDSFPLLAIPLFICTGFLMEATSMSARLVAFVEAFSGRVRGSVGIICIVSCTIFAALTGSGPATVAAIGAIMLPALLKSGYAKHTAAGLIAAGGALGPIIPPSIAMIVYGATMNESITKMFMGSIIPGLFLAFLLIVANQLFIVPKLDRSMAKEKYTIKEKVRLTWRASGTLLLPIIILGGIYGGIFTPTEASVVGVVYGILLAFFLKELNFARLLRVLERTVETSSTVVFILGASSLFAWLLTVTKIPYLVTEAVMAVISSKYVYLALLTMLLFLVGTLMETLVSIVILAPIVVPTGLTLGIDPLHLGCLFCINLIVGFISPPFGINLFTAVSVTGVKYNDVVKGVLPFLAALMIGVICITFIPQIVLWLPDLLYGAPR